MPGSLHHASDEHIRRLAARTGVVALVRQLAEDLAKRDAEVTTFRRRAEERERELKRMLREVKVSNLDIETRLHRLGNSSESAPAKGGNEKAQIDKNANRPRSRVPSVKSGIDEMMGEAMSEDVGFKTEIDDDHLDTFNGRDPQATIKAAGFIPKDNDARSTDSSLNSDNKERATARAWKDYIWSGTVRKDSRMNGLRNDGGGETEAILRSRASSGNNGRRKGLDESLFRPLQRSFTVPADSENEAEASEINPDESRSQSRSSSVSIASWTIKLFAGNSQAARDTEPPSTSRVRSTTLGTEASTQARENATPTSTMSSAKAALMKFSGTNPPTKKPVQPLPLGARGTTRSTTQSLNVPPGSPASVTAAGNLGPVEMDTILPYDSKPPTLTQDSNITSSRELLTDRFGFIYDQRRRKKEAEALALVNKRRSLSNKETYIARDTMEALLDDDAASAITSFSGQDRRPETPMSTDSKPEDRPAKRWQDYLKVATFPTELLSHTPSQAVVSFSTADAATGQSPTVFNSRESLPTTTASSVTAGNAEISNFTASAASAPMTANQQEAEPVKLLLAQLTEIHDSRQRDRTVKWNEFLRKVRAERSREGESASSIDSRSHLSMPEVSLTDGEMIGIATLGNKGKTGRAKYREFKILVLAGIPVAYRAKIWAECSGASALRVPGYYEDLISTGVDDPVILAQIQMDIRRTLTDNVFFRKGPGVAKLNEVLLAYSRRNPEVGYCQGMNLIAASLLLIMPTAEDAFWVLVSLVENILPRHYYDNSLLASRADQQVLREFVAELLPRLSTHLDELGIELEALTFQWFLSLFTDCLSAEALYRVWDVLLCCKDEDGNGGSTFLFQVALALLKLNETQLLACEGPGEVYKYLGEEITNHAISIDGLVAASEGLGRLVRRVDVEARRARWVEVGREKERDSKGAAGASLAAADDETEVELSLQSPMPIEE